MEKEKAARCLILEYLKSCADSDPEHATEISQDINSLKGIWAIQDTNPNIPGVNSILDLIPATQADIDRAIELKNEGNASMSENDFHKAILLYTQAIRLNPNQSIFYCNRAAAYSKIGKHEKAIVDAEKAISLDPKYANAYSRLGFALFSLNRIDECREVYQRGLRACPDSQNLKENLESVSPKKPGSNIINFTGNQAQLNAIVRESKALVVTDFFAQWCGHCKRMDSVLPQLAAEFPNVIFVKIDIDISKDIATLYGIQSVPTIKFFRIGDDQNMKDLATVNGADVVAIRNNIQYFQGA